MPSSFSNACSRCATTSACSPKSTIRRAKRQLGNFPQALSHIALINAGFEFNRLSSPGEQRAQSSPPEQHADSKKRRQPPA